MILNTESSRKCRNNSHTDSKKSFASQNTWPEHRLGRNINSKSLKTEWFCLTRSVCSSTPRKRPLQARIAESQRRGDVHTYSSASIWSESGPYYFPPEAVEEEKPTTPFAKLRQIIMAEPLSPDLQICEMAPSETGGLPKNERPIRRPTPDRAGKSRGSRNNLPFSLRLPLSILPQNASCHRFPLTLPLLPPPTTPT